MQILMRMLFTINRFYGLYRHKLAYRGVNGLQKTEYDRRMCSIRQASFHLFNYVTNKETVKITLFR